jgi:NAD-dependent protein deacetylase/lipoamidase
VTEGVARLAALVLEARRLVVLTGAGVSTESGIPDFRGPGGFWGRFDRTALTWNSFMDSPSGRQRYWELGRVVYPVIRDAAPGDAHRALVSLQRLHRLDCCITQNVDGLHQRAGLPPESVIELHGNATRTRCLSCRARYARDDVHAWLEAGAEVPVCPACGGIVKPESVLFGEAMPASALAEARSRARAADLFVVVGSSLSVYPAAYLPAHVREAGGRLVIVNLTATRWDTRADLVVRARAGETLSAVAAEVGTRMGVFPVPATAGGHS